jgi:hypothetical protein
MAMFSLGILLSPNQHTHMHIYDIHVHYIMTN